jgi:predicted nucleic acid-binding protein
MRLCPDANSLLAWFLPDEQSETVDRFWSTVSASDELIGAQLLLPECASAIREKVYEGRLRGERAAEILGALVALPIRISLLPAQFILSHELAERTNRRKSYDMQYVAVAKIEGGELVTLDGGVYQAAIERRVPARLLR